MAPKGAESGGRTAGPSTSGEGGAGDGAQGPSPEKHGSATAGQEGVCLRTVSKVQGGLQGAGGWMGGVWLSCDLHVTTSSHVHKYVCPSPWPHPQVLCEVHRLNSTADKLKQFIDYFLSVVMETNPTLLAGMPSLQHNTGVQPQILTTAGKSEVSVTRTEEGNTASVLTSFMHTHPSTHPSLPSSPPIPIPTPHPHPSPPPAVATGGGVTGARLPAPPALCHHPPQPGSRQRPRLTRPSDGERAGPRWGRVPSRAVTTLIYTCVYLLTVCGPNGVHVCAVCTVLYRCACAGVSDTSVVFMNDAAAPSQVDWTHARACGA